ncbi:hypothetical protein BV898_17425 [Hypsibius exemplaris]|uniref:SUEL-type lectin domain-containing protein n=1 Tax=Hypsibius exemplaris TaxID=2072580 RepID=A0A9X6RMJ7_HYPEX|nr:hypothetical protein BV898_17425 [Hypsibius exemplaris]
MRIFIFSFLIVTTILICASGESETSTATAQQAIVLTIQAGSNDTLQCDDDEVITIIGAVFDALVPTKEQQDARICTVEKDVTDQVKARCEELTSCVLSVKAVPRGFSSCNWSPRPLGVAYVCLEGQARTTMPSKSKSKNGFAALMSVVPLELLD